MFTSIGLQSVSIRSSELANFTQYACILRNYEDGLPFPNEYTISFISLSFIAMSHLEC